MIQEAIQIGLAPWKIPIPLTCNEWANENFYLAPESSSIEGPWESLPYQIGLLNWIGNDDIAIITLKKSARVGYTKILCAGNCYLIEHKKRNVAIYQPTDGDAQTFVTDEIDPLLIHVTAMNNICKSDPEKRSPNSTKFRKRFFGATLDILGGKSPRNYRRLTKDVVSYDELSGFDSDIGNEGSPTSLGDTRTQTSSFPKSIRGSTPKIKNECLISASLKEADIVLYRFLPCPQCKEYQYLKWRNGDLYQLDFDSGKYICESCGCLIGYERYPAMDAAGQWRTADEKVRYDEQLDRFVNEKGKLLQDPHHVGVSIWSAYSYFLPWADLIKEWQRATNELKDTGEFTKLKTFINTRLAEEWEERGDRLEATIFDGERLDEPTEEIPSDILLITLGVDVQGGKDARLEYEFVGWGTGDESWSIEYGVIPGDPDLEHVWDNLDETRTRLFTRTDGVRLRASCVCVDSGYCTDSVYKYTTARQRHRVFSTKGYSQKGKPIIGKPSFPVPNTILYMIGTDTAKEVLYSRLNKVKKPGPQFCHFPDDREPEYFEGLASEEKRKVKNRKTGQVTYEWVKIKERNEPLDCRVENMAAYKILNPNMAAIKRRLDLSARRIAKLREPKTGAQVTPEPTTRKKRMKRKKKKGYVNGWRR